MNAGYTDRPVGDDELWRLLKMGAREAFAALYDRYFQGLYHYGMKTSGNPEAVEDSIQDLFIDLWRMRENLAELKDKNVKFYLFRAMRRRLHRFASAELLTEHPAGAENDWNFLDALTPESAMIQQESDAGQLRQLQAAIQKLPARQLEAVNLRYYEEFSVREIAAIMSVAEQTVRNLIQQALANLRKNIDILLFLFFAILFR